MSKQRKARFSCYALPYLQPVTPILATGAALPATFLASSAQTPARAAIEARSDMTFVDDLVDSLAQHVDRPTAELATTTVLQAPTVAVHNTDKTGETHILQSLVMSATHPGEFDTQITARFAVVAGKPGGLRLLDTDVTIVDLDDTGDTCRLIAQVESWWTEFHFTAPSGPRTRLLRDWAWLGDPTRSGILDVPPDWRTRVARLGAVYGHPPHILDAAGQIKSWTLADRIEHAVALRGSKLISHLEAAAPDGKCDITDVGAYGDTFADVLERVRNDLHAEALESMRPPPTTRMLEPDEVVYHRKVGDSPKYDHFDAGSSEPCPHGADSFRPFVSADKAVKGMARRYDNFQASMLIHCKKWPDCGMYGVDASRG